MSEQKGIKELKEMVDFGIDVVNLGLDVAKDKKVDVMDLGKFVSSLPSLIASGSAAFSGSEEISLELKDLSAEESQEIIAHVMQKLSIEESKAKSIAEKALKAAYANYALIKEIKA
jgi:hypothetical protein